VRATPLRVLTFDPQVEALRMLADRREELARARTRTANRLQRLLAELTPGRAKKDITTAAAKPILAGVRPRDLAGKTQRRLAAEQLAELVVIEKKTKAATKELKAMVLSSGSRLMDLHGVGPVVAARTLADVGDVTRFADRNRFASWTGTPPLEASSGEIVRHRLSRAGNRRMNHMIHIAATTQIRLNTDGRASYRRKRADGKTHREAMRCLKRRISDALYRQLRADAQSAAMVILEAGPGGHCGASHVSSAAGPTPRTGTSDQPLPGPAMPTLPANTTLANPHPGPAPQPRRRRAGAVKVERPTGRTTLTATSAGAHSKEPIPAP